MLSSSNSISVYANAVLKYWKQWSGKDYSYRSSRLEELHKEVLRMLDTNGVPRFSLGSFNTGFDSKQWKIGVGPSVYNAENFIPAEAFLNEVELIYLSACHAE